MTNVTALEKIMRFINSESRIRQMKKWSQRFRFSNGIENHDKRSWYLKTLIRNIRHLLVLISGDDVIEMLKDVLTIAQLEQLTLPKYTDALKNISETYKNTELKQRHGIIRPLKKGSFKYAQVRRLGFSVSRPLWRTCGDSNARNKGGGRKIPVYLQHAINSYLKDKSTIASNRLVKVKNKESDDFKNLVPARYLQDNKTEIYKSFPLSNEVSKSTFIKYLNADGIYKKAHRLTDLCDYCESGRNLKTKITEIISGENYEIKEIYAIENLIKYFKNKAVLIGNELAATQNSDEIIYKALEEDYSKYKRIVSTIQDYEAVIFHKNIAKCQRMSYNMHHTNVEVLNNKILIEIDFKQKIMIGMSPRQVSSEYYNQIAHSCLGFGIYYVNNQKKIKLINFDIISSDLSSEAYAVIRGFRILRQQQFFKAIEKPEYIVWTDAGKHFRNNEFLGYLLKELAENRIHVNLNFFVDKHGKNSRDSHFSSISKFIEQESLVSKLETTEHIVKAIAKRQLMANENKTNVSHNVVTYVYALDDKIDATYKNQFRFNKTLTVRNLESFYNYRTIGERYELVTSALSNTNDTINLKEYKVSETSNEYEVVPEIKKTSDSEINFQNIHMKKLRITSAISKIKQSLKNLNNDDNNARTFFFNYFSLDPTKDVSEIHIEKEPPKTCRPLPGTIKKPACCNCKAVCSYSVESILDPNKQMTQNDIVNELALHQHPKSKKIVVNGIERQRLTHEAARELADHYIFAHNKTEPVIL